jgi:hypothetical protein
MISPVRNMRRPGNFATVSYAYSTCPFDAITKPEFHGEEEREVANLQAESICPHHFNDLTTIGFAELRTNFRSEAKSFLKVRLIHAFEAIVTRGGLC